MGEPAPTTTPPSPKEADSAALYEDLFDAAYVVWTPPSTGRPKVLPAKEGEDPLEKALEKARRNRFRATARSRSRWARLEWPGLEEPSWSGPLSDSSGEESANLADGKGGGGEGKEKAQLVRGTVPYTGLDKEYTEEEFERLIVDLDQPDAEKEKAAEKGKGKRKKKVTFKTPPASDTG